jgi:GT2 family glycosyltransferase/glycosyltransferase involved in cell wall biosynthesis
MTERGKVEGNGGEPRAGAEMSVENLRHILVERDLALQRRNRQLKELEERLREAETRHARNLAKFAKWADRIVDDFTRVLHSKRWRLGCWLSLKHSGDRSKEAQRLARLIASRPQPVAAATPKTTPLPLIDPFVPSFRDFDIESIERITTQLAIPVSIVVPVYNGPEQLQRCVKSVLAHTRTPFELILIDDASPDPAIGDLLTKYEAHRAVRVMRNPSNRGFVYSANLGMRATQHDVVLLNSDTEVTPRWLQKLIIAAYSGAKVGTVTPFSNAAGAFSVPEIGVNATIRFPFTVLKMARLTERLSNCNYPEVPTGHGFCMYIKRQVIEDLGGFDEKNFGRGYGEENDFCMKALGAGWNHILDDSLFIYHEGNSSFGEEKESLISRNRQTLDRIHPEYTVLVREFTSSPGINALRARIGDRLKNGALDLQLNKPRVLVILHEGSGGVPVTNADLAGRIGDTHQCFVLTSTGTEMILRAWQNGRAVEKQRWKLPGNWSAKNYRSDAARQVYFQVLTGLGIDLVQIHHLFKHSFDAPRLCRQLGIPVVLSFHDYYFVCPSIHLLDQNAVFCGGRCTPGLQQCTIPSPMLRDLPMLKEYLPEWREQVVQIFDCCDAFVAPAESVRDIHLSAFPQLKQKPFWVIEYGRDFRPMASVATAPRRGEPVRILAAGNLDHHKGSQFIRRLKELDTEGALEFHFLGNTDDELREIGIHYGAYNREDFPSLARAIRPSFAAIFSIWAETFSHTLTEAWSVGLPVLGAKLGAVGERISKHGGGWSVDTTDPVATLAQIRHIVTHPAVYKEMVQAVEAIRTPTVEEMTNAYRALYDHLLTPSQPEQQTRVGCIVPSGNRGSTFIRVRLPLAHEHARRRLLAVRLPARLTSKGLETWIDRLSLQTILLQREVVDQDSARSLVETCRAKRIRLVLEIDDNLLAIDRSHPEFQLYAAKSEGIRFLAQSADQVIVSTRKLAQLFHPVNNQTTVVGNALDEWLWFSPLPIPGRRAPPDVILAGYMGTRTHRADLEIIREPFLRARERLFRERGLRLVLQLVGGMDEEAPSLRWYERLEIPDRDASYPRFVRWLRQTVTWDLAVAPLAPNAFNEAKSALKFLEYAALGVPGIFSNVGEYDAALENRQTGLLIDPNSADDWEEAIVELASNCSLREKLAANARRKVLENYLLGNTVPIWVSLLAEPDSRN